MKMQKCKKEKTFLSFFQKNFRNSYLISKKQNHTKDFSISLGNIAPANSICFAAPLMSFVPVSPSLLCPGGYNADGGNPGFHVAGAEQLSRGRQMEFVFPSSRSLKTVLLSGFNEKKENIEESLFFNFPFDKGRLKNVVCWFFEKHGQYKTLKFLEKLKEVGFGSATNAGISLGIDDLKIPNQKVRLVSTAETKVAKDLLYYRNAKMTGIERIQRLIYTWNQTNDTIKQEVVRLFETTDLLNPIYMMAFSGARGNMSQVRQLVGMRGLMSDPQGQIIDFPIQSNFREGLTLTEYLISTYGARKGIVDTALRTATAGYLTRRLVDVAQHTIVSKFDCGTMRGIFLFDMKDGKKTIYSFQNRLIGRVLAQNIEFLDQTVPSSLEKKNQKTKIILSQKGHAVLNSKGDVQKVEKKQIAFRNREIDSKLAQAISKVTKKAFVRSPLTCETSCFVCQLCYGWSFSHGKLVSVGEAVGIIAAQSIGEPGTQLTMRTFHTGGVFAGGLTDQILAPFDGKIQYFQNIPGICVRNALSEIAFFTKMPGSFIVEKALRNVSQFNKENTPEKKRGEILRIPAYAVLFCRNNEFVRKKQVLAQFSSVLKKMQYGRAEQTLYSTLAGEFLFGKSFFSLKGTKQGFFPTNTGTSSLHTIGEQSLLLEKRKEGDFSEVELQNDILWKSQNWTTVWILSGNIFPESFQKNFSFQKGDSFKKTSVMKRILWRKKKRYKYFLFATPQIRNKMTKNVHYLFAEETNKAKKAFSHGAVNSFHFKTPQKNKMQFQKIYRPFSFSNSNANKASQIFIEKSKTIRTKFSLFYFSLFYKKNSFKAKKVFSYSPSVFHQFEKRNSFFSNISFDKEKNADFVYIQNKSNRFFTDFEKMNFSALQEKMNTTMNNHLFFQFLNKRKNKGSPFFLNVFTFSKTFQISQKFGFFSSIFTFPNTSFFKSNLNFKSSGEIQKNFLSSLNSRIANSSASPPKHSRGGPMQTAAPWQKKQTLFQTHFFQKAKKEFQISKRQTFSSSLKEKKESLQEKKKKVFSSSFFLNQLHTDKRFVKNFVKKRFIASTLNKRNRKNSFSSKKQIKNIFFQNSLLRFPVEKIYYKKFGYFSSFSTVVQKKKRKNFFQTFFTFTKKENFQNSTILQNGLERNIGKTESFLAGVQSGENFFGKDVPDSLSYCFFENSRLKTGGIFDFSLFKNDSKKQRVHHFVCENLSNFEENIFSLKPKFLETKTNMEMKQSFQFFAKQKKQGGKILFLYLENIFLFSNFLEKKEKDSFKKSKKILSSQKREPLFIFQIPTFSFLFLYTNSFFKPFFLRTEGVYNPNPKKTFPLVKFSLSQFVIKKEDSSVSLSKRNKKQTVMLLGQIQKKSFQTVSFPPKTNLIQKNQFSFPVGKKNFGPLSSLSEYGNGKKFSGNGQNFSFVPSSISQKKLLEKMIIGDTAVPLSKEKLSFLVLPTLDSFSQKRADLNNKGELFDKKRKFYDFSSNLFEKKTKKEKEKAFFSYNFCFHPVETFFEKNKEKNIHFDFYEKEISWLPQENFLLFTSEISKKNFSNFSSFHFYSRNDQKTFLFFVNRQGKKKPFPFIEIEKKTVLPPPNLAVEMQSHPAPLRGAQAKLRGAQAKQSSGGLSGSEILKENGFEGFVKISICKTGYGMDKKSKFAEENKKKDFQPLFQKISFFSGLDKKTNFQKNMTSKFHKRIQNTQFEKIRKLFCKKSYESENSSKDVSIGSQYSKNPSFFGKKLKTQCFTCFPFKQNQESESVILKEQNSKISLENNKLHFKVEQGWLVFPFSSPFQNSFLKTHKKMKKKGQFFEENITFEQNDVLLETVLLENFSFVSNPFPKKFSFQLDCVETNKKCRYISLKNLSLQFQIKKYTQEKTFNSGFRNTVSPFSPIMKQKSSFSQKPKMKKRNIMFFYRPFQYKILENPQNSKKFLRNICIQSFSKTSSSSCFELYKKYHSGFLNLQKKDKKFLEKNANPDFEIFSNFENVYFPESISPFISFSQQIEQVNFIKQYSGYFKSHQVEVEKKENFKNISKFQHYLSKQNIFFSNFKEKDSTSEIFEFTSEKNAKKNLFFHFTKREKKYNFSFYPVQFAPLILSFPLESFNKTRTASMNGTIQLTEKAGFSSQTGGEMQNNQIFSSDPQRQSAPPRLRLGVGGPLFTPAQRASGAKSPLGIGTNSVFPTFSMNAFQNTLEFQICEKRGAFFDERFSLLNFSDFVETSSFWLNKDSMNFLFSSSSALQKKTTKSKNVLSLSTQPRLGNLKKTQFSLSKDMNFIQNFVFQKNMNFYGSTEFMSPYEGELVPMHTHDTYWWKKASEISTLQKFEKLYTILTKKDLFSVEFPLENPFFEKMNSLPKAEKSFNNEEIFSNSRDKKRTSFSLLGENKKFINKFSLKERQKHLKKLYEVVSEISQKNNSFFNFSAAQSSVFSQSDSPKKTISSFITKYEKKIYTFQNLTVGYPSLLKKPFLGSFVVYGDNFFGSAITKPGQIIHLSFSSMTLRRGQPCLVSSNGILHFSNTPYIQKNVPLVTLPYQTVQAGDIVQGIPKVEQLFEARTTLQGRLFVSSLPILLKGIFERYKVLLPLEQAVRQSFLKIQQIIVDGVQRVYRSQGVSITDKHLEVVVRQMTTKVQILHGAQTGFFPGELVSLDLVERINKFLMVKIRYEPVILGITRASLEVDSFLSASSFQQTTKILSLAAISRKKDFLKGLKENLLVGNLIPSGTGYFNLSKRS
jgi:hypothetical protein